jgi:hypothetical protein
MSGLAVFLAAGCATRGALETLESELRQQEQLQTDLELQLKQSQAELKVARRDAESLRAQLVENRQPVLSPEQADQLYRAEAIEFNSLLTSGVERDGKPGDDGISAMLIPVDEHGEPVKLAGAIELELFDLSQRDNDQRLGFWKFSAAEAHENWRRGLLASGYQFQLDWQNVPANPELTLHARMTAPDGRQFDATTQVRIAPPISSSVSQTAPRATRPVVNSGHVESPVKGVRRAGSASPETRPRARAAGTRPPLIRPKVDESRTSDNWTDETIPRLR